MINSTDQETLDKWRKLTDRLVNATKNKKIKWADTASPAKFLTQLQSAGITITQLARPSGDEVDYRIEIIADDGSVVDSFTDVVLQESQGYGSVNYYYLLNGMFYNIRRTITGADKLLSQVIDELPPEDDEIPF